MCELEFKPWPKIPRGQHETCTISEKIDGTNACIIIKDGKLVGVQSRKRLITPEDDNYGFATWAYENANCLASLGEGYHYGEWAGEGIQKNPHKLVGKHFFLFNTYRHGNAPACVSVVPILYDGPVDSSTVEDAMNDLFYRSKKENYTPEGVVVWYHKTRRYEKHTFKMQRGKWDV